MRRSLTLMSRSGVAFLEKSSLVFRGKGDEATHRMFWAWK